MVGALFTFTVTVALALNMPPSVTVTVRLKDVLVANCRTVADAEYARGWIEDECVVRIACNSKAVAQHIAAIGIAGYHRANRRAIGAAIVDAEGLVGNCRRVVHGGHVHCQRLIVCRAEKSPSREQSRHKAGIWSHSAARRQSGFQSVRFFLAVIFFLNRKLLLETLAAFYGLPPIGIGLGLCPLSAKSDRGIR